MAEKKNIIERSIILFAFFFPSSPLNFFLMPLVFLLCFCGFLCIRVGRRLLLFSPSSFFPILP